MNSICWMRSGYGEQRRNVGTPRDDDYLFDGTKRTCEYFWGNDLSGTEQGAGGVGGLVAVSVDGAFFIPCYDHNGNIVCYVSESGTLAAQYVYDPYGNVIDLYGNALGLFNFGFSTKYFDRETGMLAYQRRFYRPNLGRWFNRDPLGESGGENLITFCLNNSIAYIDPLGMDIWVENTVAVGGFHQRVCVDVWRPSRSGSCCNGKTYCKSGKYCISFGADDGADTTDSYSGDGGSFDSDSSGDSSVSRDERTHKGGASPFPKGFDGPNDNGDGSVYSDNRDPATKIAYYFDTGDDPCVDMEILSYLRGLIGQRANYSILGQSCRSFSQAVFNRFGKQRRSK